jgi:hypothetical protein
VLLVCLLQFWRVLGLSYQQYLFLPFSSLFGGRLLLLLLLLGLLALKKGVACDAAVAECSGFPCLGTRRHSAQAGAAEMSSSGCPLWVDASGEPAQCRAKKVKAWPQAILDTAVGSFELNTNTYKIWDSRWNSQNCVSPEITFLVIRTMRSCSVVADPIQDSTLYHEQVFRITFLH